MNRNEINNLSPFRYGVTELSTKSRTINIIWKVSTIVFILEDSRYVMNPVKFGRQGNQMNLLLFGKVTKCIFI